MNKAIGIISGVLLLYGMGYGLPYSYYEFLRWVIFLSSIFFAWSFYTSKAYLAIAIFLVLAYLFNPLVPVYLHKSNWVSIDLIAALLLIAGGFYKAKKIA